MIDRTQRPTARIPATRVPTVMVYVLMVLVGVAAFLYPFWFPSEAFPGAAHAGDAPLWAAAIGALVVGAVSLEVRRGTMNGALVAVLGVLAASAALLRLVDLPGNNAGIFFLVILSGVAFGPRFGVLMGITAMATSAVVTGGIGPWLPFQMLALSWMGGTAGLLGRFSARLPARAEVLVVAGFAWGWGFAYGAVMNLWAWPFLQGKGATLWRPGLGVVGTAEHYWSYYVATSFGWDAAGALCNAILVLITGTALLRTLRRFAHRLEPAVELVPPAEHATIQS